MRASALNIVPDRHHRVSHIPASVATLAARSTPTEIRLDIQKLMQQDQMELAQALGDAGLSLHPESEDMVAICALLAMSRGDWAESRDLLLQLQEIQGNQSPASTFWLLARCHRCLGDSAAAMQTLENGLRQYGQSSELQTELTLLLKSGQA